MGCARVYHCLLCVLGARAVLVICGRVIPEVSMQISVEPRWLNEGTIVIVMYLHNVCCDFSPTCSCCVNRAVLHVCFDMVPCTGDSIPFIIMLCMSHTHLPVVCMVIGFYVQRYSAGSSLGRIIVIVDASCFFLICLCILIWSRGG